MANITIKLTQRNQSIDFTVEEFMGLKRRIDILADGLQTRPDYRNSSEHDKNLANRFFINAIIRDINKPKGRAL